MKTKSLAMLVFFMSALAFEVANVGAVPVVETGWGVINFNLGVTPKRLPRHRMAPVRIGFSGMISPQSRGQNPALREVTIDYDKNAAVDLLGLPICSRHTLASLSSVQSVKQKCGGAIVGSGSAHVRDASSPSPVLARLTFVNGGIHSPGGVRIFVHAVVAPPIAETLVGVVTLTQIHQGRFGLEAIAKLPAISSGTGSLTDFNFTVGKTFLSGGRRRSVVIARCKDGHLDAGKMDFTFDSGERFSGKTIARPCLPVG